VVAAFGVILAAAGILLVLHFSTGRPAAAALIVSGLGVVLAAQSIVAIVRMRRAAGKSSQT